MLSGNVVGFAMTTSDHTLRVRIAEAQDAIASANEWAALGRKANAAAQDANLKYCPKAASELRLDAAQCFEFEIQLRRLVTVNPEGKQ